MSQRELVVLGTASQVPTRHRNHNGYLLRWDGEGLLFDPGERWHYGTSTDVVGKLVEKVSGEKLEDYFRQHIFAPLQMPDTSYNVPQEKASRLVAAQQRAGERMDGVIGLQAPQPGLTIAEPIGGGGLASTASDYGRFMRMLLNGGELDAARVLKPRAPLAVLFSDRMFPTKAIRATPTPSSSRA